MAKKKKTNKKNVAKLKKTKATRVLKIPKGLISDIRKLIEETRAAAAAAVNAALTMLYWRIGKRINHENLKNETATISAEFYDEELQEVHLEKQDDINPLLWIIPLVIGIVFLILFYLYYFKKRHTVSDISNMVEHQELFDYRKQADILLKEAEALFKMKQYKDAYSKAGQSLRLYLSYHHGLNKELTNDEIVKYLRNKKHSFNHIRSCFNLCSLVEFAKYTANEHDFNKILNTTRNIITN